MIRAFILYYLSIKPTHGYEIQKYIQLNHMDSWTKIQSGSIYYALGKLEKEAYIELLKEENIGAKVRNVYKITDKGGEELQQCLKSELEREIYDIGSDKFVIYPLLNNIGKEELLKCVNMHIESLKIKKEEILKWQKLKISEQTLKIESLCFDMMISSLDYQIKWHEVLIEELDACIMLSKQMSDFIRQVDFSNIENIEEVIKANEQTEIERLRQEILANPDKAAEKLEELIKALKK